MKAAVAFSKTLTPDLLFLLQSQSSERRHMAIIRLTFVMRFLFWSTMLCGTAYSQEKPISSQDWRVDRDSPPRMDAMEPEIKHDRHGHSLPPWLDYNLDNGFAFLGADLKSKPKDTRVLLEDWSDRHYGASYPRMELYTLFPAFGRLYCFDKTVDKNGKFISPHLDWMTERCRLALRWDRKPIFFPCGL